MIGAIGYTQEDVNAGTPGSTSGGGGWQVGPGRRIIHPKT